MAEVAPRLVPLAGSGDGGWIPPVSGRAPPTVMSRDELRALIRACDGVPMPLGLRDKALILAAYGTAARVSEVVRFRCGGWDRSRRRLRFERPKRKDVHETPLPDFAGEVLARWLRLLYGAAWPPGALMFPGRLQPLHGACSDATSDVAAVAGACRHETGESVSAAGILTPQAVWLRLKALGRMAGIPARKCRMHCIRHTRATNLVEDGAPLPVVQALLGHRSVSMASRYISVATGLLDRWGASGL